MDQLSTVYRNGWAMLVEQELMQKLNLRPGQSIDGETLRRILLEHYSFVAAKVAIQKAAQS